MLMRNEIMLLKLVLSLLCKECENAYESDCFFKIV